MRTRLQGARPSNRVASHLLGHLRPPLSSLKAPDSLPEVRLRWMEQALLLAWPLNGAAAAVRRPARAQAHGFDLEGSAEVS